MSEEALREYQELKNKLSEMKDKAIYSSRNHDKIVGQIKYNLGKLKNLSESRIKFFNKKFVKWYNNLKDLIDKVDDDLISITVLISRDDIPGFPAWLDPKIHDMVKEFRLKYYLKNEYWSLKDEVEDIYYIHSMIFDIEDEFEDFINKIDIDEKILKYFLEE
jgi:hypothetical protein